MKTVTVPGGKIIFRQNDFGRNMFDIVSGKVSIIVDYGTEKETQVAELGENQIFGEMGMIEYNPRSATAIALEDTVLTEIEEADLNEYFRDKPEKLLQLMKQLSARLRETTEKYMDVCRAISEHEEADPFNSERAEQIRNQMEAYAMFYHQNYIP